MALLLHVLLVLEMALWVESASSATTEDFWLSTYGDVDYGRQLSEGVNIGTMSMIQCSVKCAEDASCAAVEFDGSSGRIGPCYKFTTMTHNGRMIPAPGHKYLEMRTCMKVKSVDAVVVFPSVPRALIFTGDEVYLYNLVISPSGSVSMAFHISGAMSLYFPTITTLPVQAAFLGATPETLYVLAGGQMYCFQNMFPGDPFFFTPSTPADVLTPFLTTHTGDVTAITSVTIDRTQLHLMDGDYFYKFQWNAATSKYDPIGLNPTPLSNAGEMWTGLPRNLTGWARLTDNQNFMIVEEAKLYFYYATTKTIDSILRLCDLTT